MTIRCCSLPSILLLIATGCVPPEPGDAAARPHQAHGAGDPPDPAAVGAAAPPAPAADPGDAGDGRGEPVRRQLAAVLEALAGDTALGSSCQFPPPGAARWISEPDGTTTVLLEGTCGDDDPVLAGVTAAGETLAFAARHESGRKNAPLALRRLVLRDGVLVQDDAVPSPALARALARPYLVRMAAYLSRAHGKSSSCALDPHGPAQVNGAGNGGPVAVALEGRCLGGERVTAGVGFAGEQIEVFAVRSLAGTAGQPVSVQQYAMDGAGNIAAREQGGESLGCHRCRFSLMFLITSLDEIMHVFASGWITESLVASHGLPRLWTLAGVTTLVHLFMHLGPHLVTQALGYTGAVYFCDAIGACGAADRDSAACEAFDELPAAPGWREHLAVHGFGAGDAALTVRVHGDWTEPGRTTLPINPYQEDPPTAPAQVTPGTRSIWLDATLQPAAAGTWRSDDGRFELRALPGSAVQLSRRYLDGTVRETTLSCGQADGLATPAVSGLEHPHPH
jgi:hypothetical protein